MSMVDAAIASSRLHEEGLYHGEATGLPAPKLERPSARRKMWSMWARAAVVAGDEVGGESESEVEVLGKGSGMCVAMNMW